MEIDSRECFARALLFAILAACLQTAVASSPTILVMGDSLSAAYGMATERGWVSLLAHRLDKRGYEYRVVNASISGETTEGGVARLPNTLEKHQPELVIIELGANDGLRGIDPDQIQANLTRMIELARQHGADVLLCGVQIPVNYGAAFRQLYFSVYTTIARRMEVPLVTSLLDDVARQSALMQQDGLHPTAQGQPKILDNVWPKLKASLKTASVRH